MRSDGHVHRDCAFATPAFLADDGNRLHVRIPACRLVGLPTRKVVADSG